MKTSTINKTTNQFFLTILLASLFMFLAANSFADTSKPKEKTETTEAVEEADSDSDWETSTDDDTASEEVVDDSSSDEV